MDTFKHFFEEQGPAIKPAPTKPATSPPTQPRPRHPLKPRPGVQPKPKAERSTEYVITPDAIKFIGARSSRLKNLIREEFVPMRFGEYIDDKLLQDINDGVIGIEDILPHLTDDEATYLQTVASASYESIFRDFENALDTDLTDEDVPGLLFGAMALAAKINSIEKQHTEYLEHLAVVTVLELPEFKMIKELVDSEEVTIDAQITTKLDLSQIKASGDEKDGLSEYEAANLEIFKSLDETEFDEAVLRRKLANTLIQGNAVNKFQLYRYVESDLRQINDELPKMYGLLVATGMLTYWMLDDRTAGGTGSGSGGISSISEDTIVAKGMNFIMLVHELVKGIMEYSMSNSLPDNDTLRRAVENIADGIDKERPSIIFGSEIYKAIADQIPGGESEFSLLVMQQLIGEPIENIREVISKSPRGQQIINNLIQKAKDMMNEYETDQDNYGSF